MFTTRSLSAKFASGLSVLAMIALTMFPFANTAFATPAPGQGTTPAPDACVVTTTPISIQSSTSTTADGAAAGIISPTNSNWTATMPGASWIWNAQTAANTAAQDTTTDQTVNFSNQFTIAGTPAASTLTIAADNTYTASVNGTQVGSNQSSTFANPDTITIPATDLITGTNTLTISVTNTGVAGSTWDSNPGGLMYSLTANSTNTCGTVIIKNYSCPQGTEVTRSANGVGETVPAGCTPAAGTTFGYTFQAGKTDTGAPYLGINGDPTPFAPFLATDATGTSTNNNMATGRYLVVETDANGNQLPASTPLGLYCTGDGDTSNTNDNQEVTFVSASTPTTNCVSYNAAPHVATSGMVHIFADLDGTQATAASANSVSFPMLTTFNAPNLGAAQSNVPFTLKVGGWSAGDADYEASTSTMDAGSTYTASEDTSTSLVGTSCDSGATYQLAGYSTGATLAAAQSAPITATAPTVTVDGDSYVIVHNSTCAPSGTASTLKVHVLGYLQNSDSSITQIPDNAGIAPFPMASTWTASNLNGGAQSSGTYELGDNYGASASTYGADTAAMTSPVDYTTSETTDGADLLPEGAACTAGSYELVGYKTGDTQADAESAPLTTGAPELSGITSDQYILIVNKLCGADATTTSGTTVVTPDNMNNWYFYNDLNDTVLTASSDHGFVTGPGTPPIGTGSVHLTKTTDDSFGIGTTQFAGTPLSDVTSLSYSTYRTAGTAAEVPSLGFDVNTGTGATKYEGRLTYEPYFTQTVNTGEWQTWNTLEGANWWFSHANNGSAGQVVTSCAQATPCTWAQVVAEFPNATISSAGQLIIRTNGANDEADEAFDGNADNLVVGIQSGTNTNTQTFDFDPTPVVTPEVSGPSGSLGANEFFIATPPAPTTPSTTSDTSNTQPPASNDQGQVLGASASTVNPTGEVLGAACQVYLTTYMGPGRKNDPTEVKKLQTFLNTNYNAGLPVTGFYGRLTVAAVKKFQVLNAGNVLSPWHLSDATGFVYITTENEINNIVCPGLDLTTPADLDLSDWK